MSRSILTTLSNLLLLHFICYNSILVKNNRAAAYPFGAGHCDTGTSSTARGHGGSARSLSEANIGVFWGGTELDSSSSVSSPTTMGVNKVHTITVIRTDASKFIGFLIRLSNKNGENVATSTLVASTSESQSISQYSNLCDSDAKALTHVSSNSKERVTMNLIYPVEAELLLEVTVVTNQRSNWFYGSFDIDVSGNATTTNSTLPDFSGGTSSTSSSSDRRLSIISALILPMVTTSIGIFLLV